MISSFPRRKAISRILPNDYAKNHQSYYFPFAERCIAKRPGVTYPKRCRRQARVPEGTQVGKPGGRAHHRRSRYALDGNL